MAIFELEPSQQRWPARAAIGFVTAARNAIRPKSLKIGERETQSTTWATRAKASAEIASNPALGKRTIDFLQGHPADYT